MFTRGASGKIRHIYYINMATGELTEDHREAVEMHRAGDRIAVMEEKDGRNILRVTWDH